MKQDQFLHHFNSFRAALQFMTCIPAGSVNSVSDDDRHGMLFWYPLVGAVVGLALILAEGVMSPLPALLQASLLVAVWVIITGGLHLDGLADSADAWVGGLGDRQRTLEIMRDARCGPIAVIAVTMTLIIKVAALSAFHNWVMLLFVPMAARLLIIPAFLWLPYARVSGLGGEIQQALTERAKTIGLIIIAIGALAPSLFVSLWLWLLLVGASGAVFLLWRVAMLRRLQGFTGDCIGSLVELSELVLLLVFVSFEVVN